MNVKKSLSALSGYARWLCVNHPVEIITCILTYVLLIYDDSYSIEHALLMPLVFATAYAVNNWSTYTRLPRFAYYATAALLVVALFVTEVRYFLDSPRYAFALLLSALFLLLSQRGTDNTSVADSLIRLIVGIVMAVIVASALSLLTALIYYSITYIFAIKTHSDDLLFWFLKFYWSVIAPASFLFGGRSKGEFMPNTFTNVLVNYILGSAIVIYTAILYLYLAKITIEWQLPLGGLATMITAFYLVAFFGMILNHKVPNRFYGWYYRYFGIISLPLLVLFWTGVSYRLAQYGFTMGRVYIALAGLTMTIGSLLLVAKHRTPFKTLLYIAAALIVLSTYIPGITAYNIGLQSQKSRMISLATKLHLYNESTGKLITPKSLKGINPEDYKQLTEAYDYVSRQLGYEKASKQFGTVNCDIIQKPGHYWSEERYLQNSVNVAEYPHAVPSHLYKSEFDNGQLRVTVLDKEVMKMAVNLPLDANRIPCPEPDDYVYSNNEYMLVVSNISCYGSNPRITFNGAMLFAKHPVSAPAETNAD